MTDNLSAKIKAIAPWFGGKRTMAPAIVTELGKHSQYFEPFCGSMAVLFAKKPSQKETVNDLHGDLINLARVLQQEQTAVARITSTLVQRAQPRTAVVENTFTSSITITLYSATITNGSPRSFAGTEMLAS